MLICKTTLFFTVVLVLCSLGTTRAQVTTGAPVLIDVGNTNNPYVSYLVIDDQTLGNSAFEYAWYYTGTTETDGVTPLTGQDLLNAVVNGTTNTAYALTPVYDPGYSSFVTGFQVGSQTSSIATLEDLTVTAYWTYWINGGSQTTSYPPITTVTPTNWVIAPDISLYRTITNGSYDGWTLSPFDAYYNATGPAPLSAAAVPEASSLPLLLLSLAMLAAVIRWKSSPRDSQS